MASVSVSVLGASGYSGAELLNILLRHPHVKIDKLFANSLAGEKVASVYPQFRGRTNETFELYSSEAVAKSDLVFLALPSGEAMRIVPELLASGKKVIDLSGDYRLSNQADFESYYEKKHASPELVKHATYGLPEWNKELIRNSNFISNPGCYATSAILALAPLVKEGLIESNGIVINSLSGVSGAGRKSSVDLSFTEVNENVKAYRVGDHQHTPEITMALEQIAGANISVCFVPHLIPITRGIYTTITASLAAGVDQEIVNSAYTKWYSEKPFVRYTASSVPEIKHVTHSNYIDIGSRIVETTGQVVIMSVIDNLVKGAAGQAMQNMNLMCGYSECEALL
jgi:N-acetyl-gamma-glutamyl-phosphate reductase